MKKYTYGQIARDEKLFQEYFGGKEDSSEVFNTTDFYERVQILKNTYGKDDSDTKSLIHWISGFDGNEYSSPKTDQYYELETKQEKLDFLFDFKTNIENEDLDDADIELAYEFLEREFNSACDSMKYSN